MQKTSEKILAMREAKPARPPYKSVWRYIFTTWKMATAFCVSLGLYITVRVIGLIKTAELDSIPWIRLVGTELFALIVLLATFGMIYASYKVTYGMPKTPYVMRNRKELKK